MKIHAASRHATDHDTPAHHWTIEADDYGPEQLAEIRASVPDGWKLLYVRPERD